MTNRSERSKLSRYQRNRNIGIRIYRFIHFLPNCILWIFLLAMLVEGLGDGHIIQKTIVDLIATILGYLLIALFFVLLTYLVIKLVREIVLYIWEFVFGKEVRRSSRWNWDSDGSTGWSDYSGHHGHHGGHDGGGGFFDGFFDGGGFDGGGDGGSHGGHH